MSSTETTLSFHKSIYSKAGVQAAVEMYGDYMEAIDVRDEAVEIVVTLRGFDAAYGDAMEDSFSNHALFETIVHARELLGGGSM